MEPIYSPGRERGEGSGAAEGRAGLPLGEGDKRDSGHLVPADGWEGKEIRCQVGLGSGGLRSFYSTGAKRDLLWMVLNCRRGGGTPLVYQG